ncbi:MAG: hypothetical protein JNM17_40810 [Archangium sp.]|nr:hypothetical protein [Archangium sp.]
MLALVVSAVLLARDPGDGISQLSGVAMLIVGLALSDDQPVPHGPRAWLAPAVSPNFVGANFGLHF